MAEVKSSNKIKRTGYWTFLCNPKFGDIQSHLQGIANGETTNIETWKITKWHRDFVYIDQSNIKKINE